MLHTLGPAERRVMLAHERSHLRHRHDRYRRLARFATRLNPLMAPAVGATDFLLERWADEDAARTVGNRGLTARAIARAAVSGPRPVQRNQASFAAQRVAARVDALMATSASATSRLMLVLPAALATTAVVSAIVAGHDLAHLFDLIRGDG
jgi:hypothetical protein